MFLKSSVIASQLSHNSVILVWFVAPMNLHCFALQDNIFAPVLSLLCLCSVVQQESTLLTCWPTPEGSGSSAGYVSSCRYRTASF